MGSFVSNVPAEKIKIGRVDIGELSLIVMGEYSHRPLMLFLEGRPEGGSRSLRDVHMHYLTSFLHAATLSVAEL